MPSGASAPQVGSMLAFVFHIAGGSVGLISGLVALEKSPFPFELNTVTREYFAQMAKIETGQTSADMRAILATPPDPKHGHPR